MTETVIAGAASIDGLVPPRRLAHVNLFVSDLTASLAFYTQVCGLEQVFAEPGIGACFLSNGHSHHDLAVMQVSDEALVGRDGHVQVSRGRGRHPGLNHLGWEMASEADLVTTIGALGGAGVRLHRTVDHQISHSAYLFDPDGIYHELYADVPSDWREIYRANENQLITGGWDPFATAPDPVPRWDAHPVTARVEAAPLHPVRTARATLRVTDVERAQRFYRTALGLHPVTAADPAIGSGSVSGSGPVSSSRPVPGIPGPVVLGGSVGLPDLTLVPAGALPPGLDGFTLTLDSEDDLHRGRRRLTASGTPFEEVAHSAGPRGLSLRDPDGHRVVFALLGGLER
ncbi:putative ring-cleavage extradiol dioxygenase [Frankia sp. EI5c]|uniref:VOC family protein n=1 Tax=Frankia sp. EI5c TaxID=683316 RepID=UPI0007C400E8|nr:VOC family protein [Frankia sp. EI5c]OAA18977.1 putative ring-cleavage extradiol dioxygenase [Frankia sp. EI5c]